MFGPLEFVKTKNVGDVPVTSQDCKVWLDDPNPWRRSLPIGNVDGIRSGERRGLCLPVPGEESLVKSTGAACTQWASTEAEELTR